MSIETKPSAGSHLHFIAVLIAAVMIFAPVSTVAQNQPQDCDLQAINCIGPSKATSELEYPSKPSARPTGNGADVPVLPKGNAPIGEARGRIDEDINAKIARRNAMRELQPEAAYQLSVEIGRHFGLALDGKESYEELDRMLVQEQAARERQAREQATVASSYTKCAIPGTSSKAQEGTIQCLSSFSPALCPSCRDGWRHRCERAGSGVDAAGAWRPLEECATPKPEPIAPRIEREAIRGPASNAVTQVTQGQSECDFLLENIASLGTGLSMDNADAKYKRMMEICGGDMNSCMAKIQQCSTE